MARVCAFGVNPVDAKYIIGDKFPETWMNWSAKKVTGHTPGFDFSGVVVKAPPGCRFKVGDEIFGLAADPSKIGMAYMKGSFAEYVNAPLDQIALKPASLSHAEAAALPLVGTTSVQAFQEHSLKSGQRVLIIGASGGVGHIATQVATLQGAKVTAICSSSNSDFVKTCGAESVIAYNAPGIEVIDAIRKVAEEQGKFDIVLDCVNSADSRDQAHSYRKRILDIRKQVLNTGRGADKHNYVVLGGASGEWGTALVKRFLKINLFPKNFELFWIKMPGSRPALEVLADLAECQGKGLRPKIDSLSDFSEENVRAAFETLRGRRTAGKIVLNIKPRGKLN